MLSVMVANRVLVVDDGMGKATRMPSLVREIPGVPGLIGTVLAPDVHRALGTVVERGGALVFVDEERGKEPGVDGQHVRAAS